MSQIPIEFRSSCSRSSPLASEPTEAPEAEPEPSAPAGTSALPVARAALHDAARRGSVEEVRSQLDEGMAVDAREPATGATALHQAVRSGRIEVAELLLLRGADPNARTLDGDTVLSLAQTFTPVPRLVAMLGLLRMHGARPQGGRW